MRFGRHHSTPAEQPTGNEPWAVSAVSAGSSAADGAPGRELFVRFARKNGRVVAMLRAVDQGETCVVEAQVHPDGSTQLVRPGPYTFGDANEASAFVTEAVSALMYLGCDIQAQ
jgi:hypothetical protein